MAIVFSRQMPSFLPAWIELLRRRSRTPRRRFGRMPGSLPHFRGKNRQSNSVSRRRYIKSDLLYLVAIVKSSSHTWLTQQPGMLARGLTPRLK